LYNGFTTGSFPNFMSHLGQNIPLPCDDGLGKRRWSLAILFQELNENTGPFLLYMYLIN